MKQLDKLANLLTGRRKRNFDEMHWSLLSAIGAASFLVAGYWGLALSQVVPILIEATNMHGLPPLAVGLWALIGTYAIIVWYFSCIAARCHSILYERWFK
jgi:hypothetical protein